MKLDKSTKISIRIILMFSFAMAYSFIPDYMHEFFNDTFCSSGSGYFMYSNNIEGIGSHWQFCNYAGEHQSTWHWGYRHWLFLLMGICLSIVQIVNIIHEVGKE